MSTSFNKYETLACSVICTHTQNTMDATTNLPPWPVQLSAGRSGSAGWAWRWCCKADPGTFSVWWVRSWTHCGSPWTPCEWNEPASPWRRAGRLGRSTKRTVLAVLLGGVLHILLHLVLASSRYTFLHNGSDNSDSHHFTKNKKTTSPRDSTSSRCCH